ncbi:hypothetical protein JOB18_032570 [Solea senegalensis]|uniref:Secreted protein n=1 Tax=Solea senegalensis TaxID=28829 RepID=A0AAV6QCC9_SOLSE|nr:hypothetical protein JOB18_032570 [Solea senegalensis]
MISLTLRCFLLTTRPPKINFLCDLRETDVGEGERSDVFPTDRCFYRHRWTLLLCVCVNCDCRCHCHCHRHYPREVTINFHVIPTNPSRDSLLVTVDQWWSRSSTCRRESAASSSSVVVFVSTTTADTGRVRHRHTVPTATE